MNNKPSSDSFKKAHMYFKRFKAGFNFNLLSFQELGEAQRLLKKYYKLDLVITSSNNPPHNSPAKPQAFTPENESSLLSLLIKDSSNSKKLSKQ